MVRSGPLFGRRKGSDRTTRQRRPWPLSAVAAIWDPAVSRADARKAQMPAEDNPAAAERRPPITVVLVDDEPLIRVALAQALSSSGLELVGEAATGEDAIELVVDVRPDVGSAAPRNVGSARDRTARTARAHFARAGPHP